MTRSVLFRVGLVVFALLFAACQQTAVSPSAATSASASASAPASSESPSASADGSPSESASASASASAGASPAAPAGAVLDAVTSRGRLVCGINGSLTGFSVLEGTGASGFDADFCKAVAAAVFGDPAAVEFRAVNADQRGPALQTREIDVLIRNTTWTVTRDTTWGLFAPTTFYDGQAMMVRQSVGASTLEDLAGATICVQSGTTTELNLTDRMRELGVEFTPQVYADIDQTYSAYEGERCDAVTSDRSQLVARRSEFANPDEHILLEEIMSKEPLGPVTPLGDDAWFNVVKWTVFATIEAEELGITQANVATEATSNQNPVVRRLLGAEGELGAQLGLENDWVVDVITAVGNYGEIFERNLGPLELERGQNNLWNADPPGLLYAPPYR